MGYHCSGICKCDVEGTWWGEGERVERHGAQGNSGVCSWRGCKIRKDDSCGTKTSELKNIRSRCSPRLTNAGPRKDFRIGNEAPQHILWLANWCSGWCRNSRVWCKFLACSKDLRPTCTLCSPCFLSDKHFRESIAFYSSMCPVNHRTFIACMTALYALPLRGKG